MANVLIVDDDPGVQHLACRVIKSKGHHPFSAETGEAALDVARTVDVHMAVIDIRLPGINGIETCKRLQAEHPLLAVIVISGYPLDKEAELARNAGLFDFLAKPFRWVDVLERMVHARAFKRRQEHAAIPATHPPRDDPYDELLGESDAMREVFGLISRIALTTRTVLILGETGTGKELVARAIHRTSKHSAGPFVPVNCAAVPASLVESEFFGHEPGAFTDARARRAGTFEQANHGTLFLDEIGELPMEAQPKLLRVIERREITRLGGSQTIPVDIRIIAATNVELDAAMTRGAFRRDLFHRLNAVEVRLPPLRERRGDLQLLIEHYLTKLAHELNATVANVSADARELLLAYSWPGNIRELENALSQALTTATGGAVELKDLPRSVRDPALGIAPVDLIRSPDMPLSEALGRMTERLERQWILAALHSCRGSRTEAARSLGIDRKTLFDKMRRYRITASESE